MTGVKDRSRDLKAVYLCVYACMCVLLCVCVYVCMHACVHVCVVYMCVLCACVCMYACMWMCIHVIHHWSSCQFYTWQKNPQSPTLSQGSKHPYPNIFHEKLFTPNQPNLSPDTCQCLSWTMHTPVHTFKALVRSADAKKETKVQHYP